MKQLVQTNSEDQYLVDPEKAAKVEEWLETRDPDNIIESFCKTFPQDFTVVCYNEGKIPEEKLRLHIAAIESKMPVKLFFASRGLTSTYVLDRLKKVVDNPDDDVALKGIRVALPFIYPEEKPARVKNAQQVNINVDSEKTELIERIMTKLNGQDRA